VGGTRRVGTWVEVERRVRSGGVFRLVWRNWILAELDLGLVKCHAKGPEPADPVQEPADSPRTSRGRNASGIPGAAR